MNSFEVAGTQVPGATGKAFSKTLGWESDDGLTFSPVEFSLYPLGFEPPPLYKASGIITLADIRRGLLASSSAFQVTWDIPSFSQLGWTRVPGTSPELAVRVQMQGIGQLIVSPSQYRGSQASQAAMLALTGLKVGDWCLRSDVGSAPGTMFQVTALPSNTIGNWVQRTGANAPSTAGIVVHWGDYDPQNLPQWQIVKLVTGGAGNDEWYAV
jgi:hypothetical protein